MHERASVVSHPGGAWGGDAELRRSVLDQMAAHLEVRRFGPIFAREATLTLYHPTDFATPAAVLFLPEPVLRLGYVLWSGYYDFGAERQTIEEARQIYRALAPGADLTAFADEFAAWVIADPTDGLVTVLPPPLAELAQEDADALVLDIGLREHQEGPGYLAARAALVRGDVDALAKLADTRLGATSGASDESAVLDKLRARFRDLGR